MKFHDTAEARLARNIGTMNGILERENSHEVEVLASSIRELAEIMLEDVK